MMSSVFEKHKLQIIKTHSKITQTKQEKIQSYTSLQGASKSDPNSSVTWPGQRVEWANQLTFILKWAQWARDGLLYLHVPRHSNPGSAILLQDDKPTIVHSLHKIPTHG
jgi:hypothetical protein